MANGKQICSRFEIKMNQKERQRKYEKSKREIRNIKARKREKKESIEAMMRRSAFLCGGTQQTLE